MQTTYTDRLHTLQIKKITENLVLLAQKIKNIENRLEKLEDTPSDSKSTVVNTTSPVNNESVTETHANNENSDNENEENISINIDSQ